MNRPDIIVINPDQMRADALHHLGNRASHTPNIDMLAVDGVSFSAAFCQNPVELVDFFATVLDIAGVESNHTHFGRSLTETIADRSRPVREFVCCEGGRLKNEPVMIRTREYKYVLRLYETDEFYVLDKGEEHNLIDDPQYREITADLRSKLLEWLFETSDTVPFDKDSRMPDDFYLETVNSFLKIRVSPLIKGAMKLTGTDLKTLAGKFMTLLKLDINKFNK